jgi:hypothetical protein
MIRRKESMSKDITQILQEWKYEPEKILVRIVPGSDGQSKIQLRVDLGLLQMEMDGRPDGLRPEGCESWLDYYERRQRAHDEAHPDGPAFELTAEDCARLWQEGVQYYHRYLSYWHLDLFDRCVRDTQRNLRLFAFVRTFAAEERLKLQFDQWRPYVLLMHTRALATPLLTQRAFAEAMQVIDSGIEAIRDFLEEYRQSHRAEECVELVSLEQWREEILRREAAAAAARPKSRLQLLRQKLEQAVAAEEFEEAARFRDEIRRLTETADPGENKGAGVGDQGRKVKNDES